MASSSRARARAARDRRRVRLSGRALELGQQRVPLLSAAMHYWRLSPDAWRPALREIRNMGMPIVETYVPWSVHETAPGEFDFGERDARKDVGAFLDQAADQNLFVFVRPGPHINAEMTCFGVPERIIHDKACQARSPRQNPVILPFPPQMFPVPSYASTNYHREVGAWFDAVGSVIAPRLWPDGPVVLLQVDNEAALYFRNGPYDQDYHPDAVALWRRFVAERYGELEDVAAVHRRRYATWDDVQPPEHFDAHTPAQLPIHLDWAEFQEYLIDDALHRMRQRMAQAGMKHVPVVHNVPLGDGGQPVSVPGIDRVVDLVGFDYYHPAREHRTIKRRTLYLAGTVDFPYAPELGAGAPPWFTPLAHEDSLFCAMAACAYGLRAFNLYMGVDRDRWYGAPIDARGTPRIEAGAWKHFTQRLTDVGFHELERPVEVALMVPSEYARLSRASHVLGLVSPSTLEAMGGTPVDGSREDDLGFAGPVQVLWWRMLAKASDALTRAGVPYVYVDSEADPKHLSGMKVVIAPTYEFVDSARWQQMRELGEGGTTVVYGPALPSLDRHMHALDAAPIPAGRKVLLDTPQDAEALVDELVTHCALERPFRAHPHPVETTVHHDETGPRVLFVIHPGRAPVDAIVELPAPATLHDLMHGTELQGEREVRLTMPPHSCRMFEVRLERPPEPPGRRRRASARPSSRRKP